MSENNTLATAGQKMVAEISPFMLKANDLLDQSRGIKVRGEQDVAEAVALKKQITAHRSLVRQTRLNITRQIDGLKKAIMGKEAEVLKPLDDAQNILSKEVLGYRERQEEKRRKEQARIDDLVSSVTVTESSMYRIKEVDTVKKMLRVIKNNLAGMAEADQKMTVVAVAYKESFNILTNRITFLEEQARQEAERKALDEKAAAQAAKERRIKAREEKLKRQEEQAELERQAAMERKAQVAADKNKVKTGARTVTNIEVVDASKVPREYCTPDLSKIREAVDAGATVPGVNVTKVKKL